LRGGAPPEVTAALAEVDRLETTIATLLAVARDTPRRATSTDVAAVVEAARERWHGRLAAASRPLRAPAASAQLAVRADPHVVEQILDVLLDNAASHGAGAVRIGVRELEGWLAIDVGDEGGGFGDRPEDVFARRDATANGHGIGLPLARSLAHAEGGRLSVTQPGPRPVVTLFLPRDQGRRTATS
jgi:signal transduction histidine kinase